MPRKQRKEFDFSRKDFNFLAELVSGQTGIVLKATKYEMVYSRLARRIRQLGLKSFKNYVELIREDPSGAELHALVDAMTTNLTKFFRESYQLKDFGCRLREMEKTQRGGVKKLRVWSAGCSSGQEPYSIAMIAASVLGDCSSRDILVLATDIDRNMLQKGRSGVYTSAEVSSLPEKFADKYIRDCAEGHYEIDPAVKQLVRFKQLNLLHDWPMQNGFDFIFCRNVLIYFDAETKDSLVDQFSGKLNPGGMLYLGHSEALIGDRQAIAPSGRASFRKVAS
ncbi:CheR family methyltransferase [Emcibacter nanhaiensis]